MQKNLSSDLPQMQVQDYLFVFASFRYSDIYQFKDHAGHNRSVIGFYKHLYLVEIQEKFTGHSNLLRMELRRRGAIVGSELRNKAVAVFPLGPGTSNAHWFLLSYQFIDSCAGV